MAAVLAAGVVTTTQAAAAAEGVVHKAAGAQAVPGKYIVALKPDQRGAAKALVGKHGGRVDRAYRAALNGFAMTATEEQAKRLAADPRVARVEADVVVRASGNQVLPPWDLDRIDQRDTVLNDSYRYHDTAGAGVTAYVLDTGVRTTHSEFEGRASIGFDAVDDGWNGGDCSINGHGTHVAGTIAGKTYGVAKKAKIVSVRVLGCEDFGTTSQVVAGVDWVTANGQAPAVVNMSLGGGVSELQDSAVTKSISTGFSYALAAGNDDRNACDVSPARTPRAITVGASNPVDERAEWRTPGSSITRASNYGPCLDLFAPGEAIKSAHNATDNATVTLFGTSMAAPHVAGAAALLLSESPNLEPDQVTAAIVNNATAGALKPDTLKPGSPNRLLHTSPPPRGQCVLGDSTRRPIPDLGSVEATLDVTACDRAVSSTARVAVRAQHPCRGDLAVRLIAPNGAERVLKSPDSGDSVADLDQTFPIGDLTAVDANGKWKLVVQDSFGFDEGALLGWTLTLADPRPAPPVVSSTVYPADGQPHGGIGVPGTFTLRAGDAVPVVKYAYQLDTAAPIEVAGSEATVTVTPTAGGRRALTVRAYTAAGDPSAATRYDFLVTEPAPQAPVVSSSDYPADGHPNGVAGGAGTFSFRPGGAGQVTRYTYQLDTDGQPKEVVGSGEVKVSIAPGAGSRTLTVRSYNGLTASPPTTHFFVVAGPADIVEAGDLTIDGVGITATAAADKSVRLRYTAAAGDRLGIGLDDNTFNAATRVWVTDPAGRAFSVEPNQEPSYAATGAGRSIPLPIATSAGTYQIVVDPDGSGAGSATVSVSRAAAGTTDTAAPGHAFSFSSAGKFADVTFDAAAKAWYNIGFTDLTGSTAPRSIDVFDADGTRVGQTLLLNGVGRFQAQVAGRHRILVGVHSGQAAAGKVWLSNEFLGGQLTTGTTGRLASLPRPGQQGRFTFTGTAGQRLSLAYTTVSLGAGTPGGYVIDPTGAVITPTGLGATTAMPRLTLTGAYEVVVNGGSGTGSFAVWLSQETAGGAITTTGSGRTASAGRPGQRTRFTFTGTAGQRLNVGFTNPGAGIDGQHVQLVRPDGTVSELVSVGAPGSLQLEVLPATGTYELAVNPASAVTGSVLTTLSTPVDGGLVTIGGAAVNLSVTRAGQDGQVSFSGVVGDRLRVTFANNTFANKTFALTVLRPDGTRLVDRVVRTDLTPYDLPELAVAGSYVVIVDPAVAGTGAMAVGVARTP
ncbi:Peptidase inhibitor I9 [Actinokineospora diospyrosa]|uniref:Peptidase inhibitor I9 n=1 Tax=Actinokineospora diospyrosa TaxID=103728 RepID=A0ABT1I5K0_9PSEU|nr:Peptidase inhibitor I9 [Actinokineospora diospyrosa]